MTIPYIGGIFVLESIDLKSISSSFYAHIFVRKFVQSQTLSREKLLKRHMYEKFARKTLLKLTPGLISSNLRPNFSSHMDVANFFSVLSFSVSHGETEW